MLLDGIFRRFPSVQNTGFTGDSYKPGLGRMREFLRLLGQPHESFKSVHVAGTNGKGSVSSMIASVLASNGRKTGLYTSPHILDFRERMKVIDNRAGEVGATLIPKDYVYSFLKRWQKTFEELNLSFFEITTGMAFRWFADEKIDTAVIEVGLGGRLDSTNVITPILSIITSIGLDHCDLLGDTLEKIAFEKAGIIKPGVPVVIGEQKSETAPVFLSKAKEAGSPIYFAGQMEESLIRRAESQTLDLRGEYQKANLRTVLQTLDVLEIEPDFEALAHTARHTGLNGRWEHLSEDPLVICDIGHNAHALSHNFAQLDNMLSTGGYDCLIIVYAVMADKDLDSILPLMPQRARYIFTTPKGKRALPAAKILERFGREAEAIDDVQEAVKTAISEASAYKKPLIYIGGSTFAVSEATLLFKRQP